MEHPEILYIEDNFVDLMLVKAVLKKEGFTGKLSHCENGRTALDFVKDQITATGQAPDVILLDLNMPVLDGYGFLDELKNVEIPQIKQTPIFILTSSDDWNDKDKCANYPSVKGFFIKPLDVKSYQKMVDEVGFENQTNT